MAGTGKEPLALQYVTWKYATFIAANTITVGTYDPAGLNYGETTITNTVTYGSMAFSSENVLLSTMGHEDVHVDQPWHTQYPAIFDKISYGLRAYPPPPTLPPAGSEGGEWGTLEAPGYLWEVSNSVATGIDNDGPYLVRTMTEWAFFSFLMNFCN
jgi:hypothetical protein